MATNKKKPLEPKVAIFEMPHRGDLIKRLKRVHACVCVWVYVHAYVCVFMRAYVYD